MPNYTYTGDPGSSDVDFVRFMINDTAAPWRLSDEEIEFLISQAGDPSIAAADAADQVGGRLSTKADKTVGPLRISYSAQATSYFILARNIRSRAARRSGSGPILTQTDRKALFTIGMHDYRGSSRNPLYGGFTEDECGVPDVGDTGEDFVADYNSGL